MDENTMKALIFERLCQKRKERGEDGVLNAETLRRELNLPEDAPYGKVLEWLTVDGGGIYINTSRDTKEVWLGTGGKQACDEGRNPFR